MSRSGRLPRVWHELAAQARTAGWRVERRRSGHLAWIPPRGDIVISPYSPSDHRSIRNTAAHLRRHGLNVPHRKGEHHS